MRSLAFVQSLTGCEFALPLELDNDDLRALGEAEALLRGGTTSSRWTAATLGLTTIDAALLDVVDGGAVFRLEFIAPIVARIAGHEVVLGDASYVFRVAVLENYDELLGASDASEVTGAEAHLRPGADDSYEVTLIAPPEIGLDDQDVRPPVVASRTDLDAVRRKLLRRDAFQSEAS